MAKQLEGALPIIVTNYSRHFGVLVRMQGSCAYTNGHTITIPRLDLYDPIKSRLAYGYLAHEAAHVRWTKFKTLARYRKNFLFYTLINILEDARHREAHRQAIYRGVGEHGAVALKPALSLRGYAANGARSHRRSSRSSHGLHPLLHRGLLPALPGAEAPRSPHAEVARQKRMDHATVAGRCAQSLKVLKANDTEIVRIVRAIYDIINKDGVFKKSELRVQEPNIGEIYGFSMRPPRCADQAKSKRPVVPEACAELKAECKEFERATDSRMARVAPGAEHSTLGSSLSEDGLSGREERGLFEVGECAPGRADFIKRAADTIPLRRALHARVRAYVDAFGSSTFKGTRINAQRASLVPLGETHIFLDKVEVLDYSTSVHLLVDCSGSMLSYDGGTEMSRCEAACRSALSLALALEGIDGIRTMCSFFPGRSKEIEVALHAGERATQRQAYFDQTARGSTPLAQTLWHAIRCAKASECKRRIVMVLTDGMPDSVKQAETALEAGKAEDIEFYGIGIRLEYIKTLIPGSVTIQSPSELAGAVFGLFGSIFRPAQASEAV